MGPEEPDHQDARLILQGRDQSIVVALDVEHGPPALQYARSRMRGFHLLRVAPLRPTGDCQPDVILRSRGPDFPVAGMSGKVALDRLCADHDHCRRNGVPAAATASVSRVGETGYEESMMQRPA